jgi:hypothetical protein
MRDAASAVIRLVVVALRTRFGLARPTGPLRLVGAVTDPFIYAGIVYLVLAGVFGRTGFDRYFFLAIGFASFRWTFGCVLDAADPVFVAHAWARIAAEAAAGRRLAVVTYHLQLPPSATAGSFVAVRGGRMLRAGAITADPVLNSEVARRMGRDLGYAPRRFLAGGRADLGL